MTKEKEEKPNELESTIVKKLVDIGKHYLDNVGNSIVKSDGKDNAKSDSTPKNEADLAKDKIKQVENSSKQVNKVIIKNGKYLSDNADKQFDKSLEKIDLTPTQREAVKNIFKETVSSNIKESTENLTKKADNNENVLEDGSLAANSVKVLEGILDCKKKLDKAVPNLAPDIIKIASPILVNAISTFAPGLGTVLQNSKILEGIAGVLLDTKTLEVGVNLITACIKKYCAEPGLNKTLEKGVNDAKRVVPPISLKDKDVLKNNLESTGKTTDAPDKVKIAPRSQSQSGGRSI